MCWCRKHAEHLLGELRLLMFEVGDSVVVCFCIYLESLDKQLGPRRACERYRDFSCKMAWRNIEYINHNSVPRSLKFCFLDKISKKYMYILFDERGNVLLVHIKFHREFLGMGDQ